MKDNILTPQQLKIFRHWLVDCGFYPSYTKAIKATGSHLRCHDVFLQVIPYATESQLSRIEDILEVYAVEDDIDVNKISNCIDNLPIQDVIELNCIYKKVRGKQITPTMRPYLVRLPNDMLEQLNALDGTASKHIRQAINNYLQEQL